MNTYIIIDSQTLKVYGLSNKRWLSRLFYIQRREYNDNLIIRKNKEPDKFSTRLNDLYLHYFSGFAVTNKELEYMDYQLEISKFGHPPEDIPKTKKIKRFLKKYYDVILPGYKEWIILEAIVRPALVDELLEQKHFLASINKMT